MVLKDLLARRKALLKTWNRFAELAALYSETTPLEAESIEHFGYVAREFITELKQDFPSISITPKLHNLGNHFVQFMRLYKGMGRFAEQGLERMHQVLPVRGFREPSPLGTLPEATG